MKAKKVLVVDDSKLLHKMYEMILRDVARVHASDGLDGLEKLALPENADVDLILLDVNMPRMNGHQFLARIKADAVKKSIPVIMITTEGKEADAQRAIQAGASAYLRKPFRHEELRAAIEALGQTG